MNTHNQKVTWFKRDDNTVVVLRIPFDNLQRTENHMTTLTHCSLITSVGFYCPCNSLLGIAPQRHLDVKGNGFGQRIHYFLGNDSPLLSPFPLQTIKQ